MPNSNKRSAVKPHVLFSPHARSPFISLLTDILFSLEFYTLFSKLPFIFFSVHYYSSLQTMTWDPAGFPHLQSFYSTKNKFSRKITQRVQKI